MNVRSLVNFERRAKLSDAIICGTYSIICLCETWLNEQIDSSELLFNEFSVYRADRQTVNDSNKHGGSLIAVKNSLDSQQVNVTLPDSCVLCKIRIGNEDIFVCCFYNPPKSSQYRYSQEDFNMLLAAIPKKSAVIICGDINFPETNWNTTTSTSEEEQNIIDLFESNLLKQSVEFPTCSSNTLDVAYYRNVSVSATPNEFFDKIYDCSDHRSILLSFEFEQLKPKPVLQKYWSFGRADFEGINITMKQNPFVPICFSNIDQMLKQLYEYLENLFESYVPRRTAHRQQLPPWITPSTSNLMKKLATQKRLLETKPTSYRQRTVSHLESVVLESAEIDRANYQQSLLGTGNTDIIFKHLKSLNKSASLPKVMTNGGVSATKANEKVSLLNEFFHSVFSPKSDFNLDDIQCEDPLLTDFDISESTIRELLLSLDVSKSRGPNGLPPSLFQKTANQMSAFLHAVFRNIKRLQKLPKIWKIAAVSPIFKNGDRRAVGNYRPISLLNVDSKIFEKCVYKSLYAHFSSHLSSCQHGFVKNKSVNTNMISFLNKIYRALDENQHNEVVAFYVDFAKAFDKVPHLELLQKVANLRVGGKILAILFDYLQERKQFVRVDNVSSEKLDVTSGVPQGSLLGPLLFCIFINDLPDRFKFSDPSIYADDLKFVSVNVDVIDTQYDLNALNNWAKENKSEPSATKCTKVIFRGKSYDHTLAGHVLQASEQAKDLGIYIDSKLSWTKHIDSRLTKANKAFYCVRRNISHKVPIPIKLKVFKSIIVPILTYGLFCTNPSRGDLKRLEHFQKRVLNWILPYNMNEYADKLRNLNILPLTMFNQLNDLLLLSSLENSGNQISNLKSGSGSNQRRVQGVFEQSPARTEKMRGEFIFRVCRIANRIHPNVNFENKIGLKDRIIKQMWATFNEKYSETNICTWQIACDCQVCRNNWTRL